MATVDEAVASFERNIEVQTGRSVDAWAAVLREQRLTKHAQMVAWLKFDRSLSHAHANHIAKRVMQASAPRSGDDPIGYLFEGGKEGLRVIYERLAAEAAALGPDVEVALKKANVSVRRRKQFALIQPTTRIRMDLA